MRLVNGFSWTQPTDGDARVVALRPVSEYPGCRDLDAYWDALRGSSIVPKRTEFDPRGIERSLTHTFVAERVAASVVRLRVAGSQLNDLLGMDVRGMPLSAFFDPSSRDLLADLCRRLFDAPEKITLDLTAPGRLGRAPLNARLILLPMSDGQGEVTRVVGCLESAGAPGHRPRRFSITHVDATALEGHAPAPAPARATPQYAQPSVPQHAPEMADIDQPAFRSRRKHVRRTDTHGATPRKAHLRLVVSNS